jgi:hypothetical protein
VKAAQDSLSAEKKKIDNEINQKIKETEEMRHNFQDKAERRSDAERRAAVLREKMEIEEHEADKLRRTKQLEETQEIEQRAYELHEKESELRRQKSLVRDALEEVDEEIHRVTHAIESARK